MIETLQQKEKYIQRILEEKEVINESFKVMEEGMRKSGSKLH